MGLGYRHVLAGTLLMGLALPVSAAVTLTTERLTGTGLPPGQTLPESPPQETAPTEPFTPKTITTERLQGWGPLATTPGAAPSESTSGTGTGESPATESSTTGTAPAAATTTDSRKPTVRRIERVRPRIKEVPKEEPKIVNPVRKLP